MFTKTCLGGTTSRPGKGKARGWIRVDYKVFLTRFIDYNNDYGPTNRPTNLLKGCVDASKKLNKVKHCLNKDPTEGRDQDRIAE